MPTKEQIPQVPETPRAADGRDDVAELGGAVWSAVQGIAQDARTVASLVRGKAAGDKIMEKS